MRTLIDLFNAHLAEPVEFVPFDEMYELKPEYKRKKLQAQIDGLTKRVESLTTLLSEAKDLLEKKKKELNEIK